MELYFKNQKDWRNWLSKNHKKEKEVWIIYYKKNSGKESITHMEAVEEALCFGWIDSIIQKLIVNVISKNSLLEIQKVFGQKLTRTLQCS